MMSIKSTTSHFIKVREKYIYLEYWDYSICYFSLPELLQRPTRLQQHGIHSFELLSVLPAKQQHLVHTVGGVYAALQVEQTSYTVRKTYAVIVH